MDDVLRFERIAFGAWPAARVLAHRGVLLRHTGGESRRANSAAVHACDPSLAVDEIVQVTERFYAERGRPSLLQLGPTAPRGLDEALAARGYEVVAPVHAQTAPLATVLCAARPLPPGLVVEIDQTPSAGWIEIEVARGRYAEIASTFLGALATLAPRAGFAVARDAEGPLAACLVVHDQEVAVLAAMRTLPEARRRGAARALLDASARWAEARGARTMYLQVDRGNVAAIALYESAGLATLYDYHYRELALARSVVER